MPESWLKAEPIATASASASLLALQSRSHRNLTAHMGLVKVISRFATCRVKVSIGKYVARSLACGCWLAANWIMADKHAPSPKCATCRNGAGTLSGQKLASPGLHHRPVLAACIAQSGFSTACQPRNVRGG